MDWQVKYTTKVTTIHDDQERSPSEENKDRGPSAPFDGHQEPGFELGPVGATNNSITIPIPPGVGALKIAASGPLDACFTTPSCGEGQQDVQSLWHLVPIPGITEETETDDAFVYFLGLDPTKHGPTSVTFSNPSPKEDVSGVLELWHA